MDVNQQAEFSIIRGAQSFLVVNAARLASVNETPARADLDDVVRLLEEEAIAQQQSAAASESLTAVKREVHARLRREIGRIRALVEARPGATPNLKVFKRLSKNTSDASLEVYAGALAQIAEEYAEVFRREGFGEDFVARFRELIAEFRSVIHDRDLHDQRRFLASRRIEASLARGWKTVALLGALFDPDEREQRRLQSEWKTQTQHAARALPAPAPVPRLSSGERTSMPALPAGDQPTPSVSLVARSEDSPPAEKPVRRRLLRLFAKLFRADAA